jgi:K+-transporting ATPase KdpF subunit
MNWVNVFLLTVSTAIFGYLVFAMVKPEKF